MTSHAGFSGTMAVILDSFITAGSDDLVYVFSVWIGSWFSAAGISGFIGL
jgi:hypothetical protein